MQSLLRVLVAALIIGPSGAVAQSDSAFSVPIEVKSQGITMRATLFVAAGLEPHATHVTLKGFPDGNSSTLQKFMQSRGFNAIALNFRGQHDSDGTYDVAGTAADAATLMTFLRSDSARRAFRIDPQRIVLSGQSAGSYATLTTAAADQSIRCVSLTVPFNWALPLLDMRRSPIIRTAMVNTLNRIANRTPSVVRLDTAFVQRSIDMAESFDLRSVASRVKGRNIWMIGAGRDGTAPMALHFNPVRDSLRSAGSIVRDTTFDDTHELPASGPAVYELSAAWVGECTR
jgi:alpha/beta superfamily hydrolase